MSAKKRILKAMAEVAAFAGGDYTGPPFIANIPQPDGTMKRVEVRTLEELRAAEEEALSPSPPQVR